MIRFTRLICTVTMSFVTLVTIMFLLYTQFAHKASFFCVHGLYFLPFYDHSLLPVMARLCTKVFWVKQYRMISGMQQTSTPMEISCC